MVDVRKSCAESAGANFSGIALKSTVVAAEKIGIYGWITLPIYARMWATGRSFP